MRRGFLQLWVVITLIFVVGVHWIILQSVAWTGMVFVYSRTAPLREALAKTFDGQHPCTLCKAVQEGKKSEQKLPTNQVTTKLDFFCNPELLAIELPPPFSQPDSFSKHVPTRTEAPPSPPPRLS